jgi:hypothetical protein
MTVKSFVVQAPGISLAKVCTPSVRIPRRLRNETIKIWFEKNQDSFHDFQEIKL